MVLLAVPDEYHGRRLFVCEYTLKYMRHASAMRRHREKSPLRHPPGNQIYRESATGLSLWEVDGRANKIYCQNLCLLSKLFLDHKTLYYDVDPFLFYVLTLYRDDASDERAGGGHQILGYFSKEKVSARTTTSRASSRSRRSSSGYGKLLISLSYELTKLEGKVGSPEKPLGPRQDLGRSYWTWVLLEVLSGYDGDASIRSLGAHRHQDGGHHLDGSALNMIKYWKGQHVILVSQKAIDENLKAAKRPKLCDPTCLKWTPQQWT